MRFLAYNKDMAREPAVHSRLKEQRRKRRAIVIYFSIFLLLAGITAVVLVIRLPSLRISAIDATGSETIATSTIAEFAWHDLSGDYWFVIPKDSILFYPRQQLQADTLAAFAPLQSALVRSDSFTKISVTVAERHPSALWCGDASAAVSATSSPQTPCLLLDQSGVAYAPAPQFSAPIYMTYYGNLPEGGAELPVQFLTPSEFSSLSSLVGALAQKANAGGVVSVAVDDSDDVALRFADGFLLKFSALDDASVTLDHFSVALSTDVFTTHALSDFEYLDLRFGDKLYYKLK